MSKFPRIFIGVLAASALGLAVAAPFFPQAAPVPLQVQNPISRPQYAIRANIDTELLTLRGAANVRVPAKNGDPVSDAVFFLYANADGVGGADGKRKNLVVDGVSFGGENVPFSLNGAVLRAKLPTPQSAPFELKISWHGVVPRAPKQEGAMGGMLGAEIDLSAILGGQAGGNSAKPKAKNTDYGLYTFGDGILSLGSFWYPQLAVRENRKWADAAPEGLGDVAYSEWSDFSATLDLPQDWKVVAPGEVTRNGQSVQIRAQNVRDLAVLASEEYQMRAKNFEVGGKLVRVESFATKDGAAKMDEALEVAGKSLQVFAKRFGPYPYENFKVAQAPLRGGAGGMEYSGMTGIASMVYGDMGKQLGGLVTSLNLPGAEGLLEGMGLEGGAAPQSQPHETGGVGDMLGGVLSGQKEMLESMLETTVAHEVAHQWWAIGVGSDSQNHPFVDESLTNWSAMLYYEDRYGKEAAQKQIDLNLKTTFSMGAMIGGGDKPANLRTADYSGNVQYGAVIYGKGAYFYTQLRALVGDEAFFKALRTYYAQFNGKIAGANSLRAIFEAQNPGKKAQIASLYARWIEGAHGQEDLGSGIGGLDIGGLLGGLLGGGGDAMDGS